MIMNKLSILLAEKQMKSTTLSKMANISQNTISSISQNKIKMIQLETLDKICKALEIEPADFFVYSPYEVDFSIKIDKEKGGFKHYVGEDYKDSSYPIKCDINLYIQKNKIVSVSYEGKMNLTDLDPVTNYDTSILFITLIPVENQEEALKILFDIPAPILERIKEDFAEEIYIFFDKEKKRKYSYSIKLG